MWQTLYLSKFCVHQQRLLIRNTLDIMHCGKNITKSYENHIWGKRYTQGSHWSVYVLGDFKYFHFNSMVIVGLHASSKKCVLLAKMWCARKWYNDDDYDIWRKTQPPHSWVQVQVPQQNSGRTCGFYMLKNIMEFTRALRYRPHTMCEVN